MEDFCNHIHRSLVKDVKYVLVWGTSGKHYPQHCGLGHVLQDEDVVQIVKKKVKKSVSLDFVKFYLVLDCNWGCCSVVFTFYVHIIAFGTLIYLILKEKNINFSVESYIPDTHIEIWIP